MKQENSQFQKFRAYVKQVTRQHISVAEYGTMRVDDEAEDVASTLWMRKDELMASGKFENETAVIGYLRNAAVGRVLDHLRYLKADKRQFDVHAETIDAAPRGWYDEDGNENNIEPPYRSDGGAQAEAIRNVGEAPEWRLMTRREFLRIRRTHHGKYREASRVANAMLKTYTDDNIMKKAKVKRRRFAPILKFLQMRFAQCYKAYRAYLAERWCTKLF